MGVVVDSDRMFRRSLQSLGRTIRIGQASAGSVTAPMTVVDDLSYWAGSVLSDPNNECVQAQIKPAIEQRQNLGVRPPDRSPSGSRTPQQLGRCMVSRPCPRLLSPIRTSGQAARNGEDDDDQGGATDGRLLVG